MHMIYDIQTPHGDHSMYMTISSLLKKVIKLVGCDLSLINPY